MNITSLNEEFYVYLTSEKGTSHDFTVRLPKALHLDNSWKVAFAEITFINSSAVKNGDFVFIESDLAEPSIHNQKLRPILAVVPIMLRRKNRVYFSSPHERQYHRVTGNDRQEIRVYIRTPTGDDATFLDKPLTITLHFKRIF